MTDNARRPDRSQSLASQIQVSQSGVRSINIERDFLNPGIAESYILTTQSRMTLARLLNRFNGAASVRAWTLTGPYGSGKSFFSLFLMNLACASQPSHRSTLDKLAEVDPLLTEQVTDLFLLERGAGLLPVGITGYRAPITVCLKTGFKQALRYLPESDGLRELSTDLNAWSAETDTRSIIGWIQKLLATVADPGTGYEGVLLIFDELGKPLEFAAAHPDKADVYLLQELAELANRTGTEPLLFIGVLHQSFERYAALLNLATQQEWAKVQGRFEDVAFQEPPIFQMRLIADTISWVEASAKEAYRPVLSQALQEAIASEWCPPLMDEDEFAELCHRSLPLHPTALVALPHLFRRLAQNERSIFAYLSSGEPFGFQEFLVRHELPALVRLSDLYDYLMANYQGRLQLFGRTRVLLETEERLQTTPNLSLLQSEILKTIGLLNWLSETGNLHATEAALLMALRAPNRPDHELKATLHQLEQRSIIVYRRFNKTYSIWQGSDVDLEEQLHKARQKLSGSFSIADALQRYLPPRPLVARRHSYKSGTLRYFEASYVDNVNRDSISFTVSEGASGRILLCLPANLLELNEFVTWAQSQAVPEQQPIIVGIVTQAMRLNELLHELRCLHWVRENTPELRDDPVARRELRLRLAAVESMISGELDRSFSLHQLGESDGCHWYFSSERINLTRKKGLSHLLSDICDQIYAQTPRLRNELINRRTLTSQGAAARRNLIEAMLSNADQPRLGITGFPPERSMYESLLLASGLHVEMPDGRWTFQAPQAADPLQLRHVWQAISDFISVEPPHPRPVGELFALLAKPPFGLTDGVLPVLLCAFLLVNQAETTLYREGTLLPEPGIAVWEVLLRRPELFQVAGCRVTGPVAQVVERFARGLGTDAAVMPVVRDLIRRFNSLPEHTWRTQNLSKRTIAVRQAIGNARSPEQLLFQELPTALDLPALTSNPPSSAFVETFFDRLNGAMSELASDLPRLRAWARDRLLQACNLSSGDEGWDQFLYLAQEMTPRVINPNLSPLFKRATESDDAHAALDRALALIAGRPLPSWSDMDVQRFDTHARFLGRLLQAERNGSAPTTMLNEADRRRSQEMIEELQQHLQARYQPTEWPLLQVALQLLAHQYQSKLTDEPL